MRFSVKLIVIVILLVGLASLPPVTYAGGQWVKYPGNPVLKPTPNAWDSDYTNSPKVIFDGTIYRMWYIGSRGGSTAVGYANSTDGVVWQKYPTPVMLPGPTGSWDSSKIGLGSVLRNGTQFLMWYQGSSPIAYPNGAIGLAMSSDGLSWTKYSGNPVLVSTLVDQRYIASPFVVKLNATYNMWYTAKSASDPAASQITRILLATSYDGIKWTKWPTPVLQPSPNASAWDSASVFSPAVVYDGSTFGIWYSGLNGTLLPQVGYASSPDGATWTDSSANPILSPGQAGSWDSGGVQQASVAVGNGFLLFYNGFTEIATGAIGLARAPQGFTIAEFPTSSLSLGVILTASICIIGVQLKRKRN